MFSYIFFHASMSPFVNENIFKAFKQNVTIVNSFCGICCDFLSFFFSLYIIKLRPAQREFLDVWKTHILTFPSIKSYHTNTLFKNRCKLRHTLTHNQSNSFGFKGFCFIIFYFLFGILALEHWWDFDEKNRKLIVLRSQVRSVHTSIVWLDWRRYDFWYILWKWIGMASAN